VEWSPDGTQLAGIGYDRAIRVWDAATGNRLQRWSNFGSKTNDLDWSPDGALLASSSIERGIDIWKVGTGEHLRQIQGENQRHNSVAWHPNMRFLAAGVFRGGNSLGHFVKIFDASTGVELASQKSSRSDVFDVAWSPNGKRLAASYHPGTVAIWSFDGERLEQDLALDHTNTVDDLAWDSTGQYLATASRGQQVTIWDTTKGAKHRTFQGHLGSVSSVDWSPDNTFVVSAGSRDGTARVWDLNTNLDSVLASVGSHHGLVQWSPNGERILLPIDAGWRVTTPNGQSELTVELPHRSGQSICCWSPDASAVVLCHAGDNSPQAITVVNARTGENVFSAPLTNHVWSVSWSPDSKCLAVAYEEKQVAIWSTDTWEKSHLINVPEEASGVAFSPDSTQLAIGVKNGELTLWSVSDWKHIGTLSGHYRWIGKIAWSGDGRKIAAGGFDTIARIWDVASRSELQTLVGHSSGIESITWSPNGERIATGSSDGTLRIWAADSGEELLVFHEGRSNVFAAWSPDGMKIASLCFGSLVVRDASAGYKAANSDDYARDRAMRRRTPARPARIQSEQAEAARPL
jgi:WD40 repeat protein